MRQQNCLERKGNPWLHTGTILRETPSVQSSFRYQEREISTARATLLWEGWWQCWPSSALFCHLFALLRGHSLSCLLRPTLLPQPTATSLSRQKIPPLAHSQSASSHTPKCPRVGWSRRVDLGLRSKSELRVPPPANSCGHQETPSVSLPFKLSDPPSHAPEIRTSVLKPRLQEPD